MVSSSVVSAVVGLSSVGSHNGGRSVVAAVDGLDDAFSGRRCGGCVLLPLLPMMESQLERHRIQTRVQRLKRTAAGVWESSFEAGGFVVCFTFSSPSSVKCFVK